MRNSHSKYWQKFVKAADDKHKAELKASEDKLLETFDAEEHWHYNYEIGLANHYEKTFNESQNALDGLNALQAHLSADIALPNNLREWAAEALLYTLKSEGKITLDQAFGLVETVGQINAFTEKRKEDALYMPLQIMRQLIDYFGFSISLVSRLAHKRMQFEAKNENDIVYEPETLRRKYDSKSEEVVIPDTNTIGYPICITEDDLIVDKYGRLHFLSSFDFDDLSPNDKSVLWRQMDEDNLTELEWSKLTKCLEALRESEIRHYAGINASR